MLLKHLLQLLCIESARTVIIKLKEDVLHIVLSLQLHFGLDIEVFGCVLVARHKPVLSGLTAHDVAHTPIN